jgi:Flp pilus assembly protein TadG
MTKRASNFNQGKLVKWILRVLKREGYIGQGVVEFAVALPVVLLVILGTVEFGRLMITHTAISSASREAARFGAAVGNLDLGVLPPYEDCAGIRDAAKQTTRAFMVLDDAEINIEYDKGPGTAIYSVCSPPTNSVELGDRIVVSITTTYEPLIPLGFGSFEVTSVTKRSIAKVVIVD